MSIGSALSIAIAGLRATQAEVDVVAGNISHASVSGYTRRVAVTEEVAPAGLAVRSRVERAFDAALQRRSADAATDAAAASIRASYLDRLDQAYGAPEAEASLQATLGRFDDALNSLANDPASAAGRSQAAMAAEELAARLRDLSGSVQALRTDAEQAIGETVDHMNELINRIGELNQGIVAQSKSSTPPNGLLDQRDAAVAELAGLIGIDIETLPSGAISLRTDTGLSLAPPAKLSFDGRAALGPEQLYDTDPTRRGVGTIRLETGGGGSIDLLSHGLVKSGTLGALVELRDTTLVAAQDRLDSLAAGLASAISDRSVEGTSAAAGAATGFDLDLAGLAAGNVARVEIVSGGQTKVVSFVATDAANAGALAGDVTAESGDTVVGIDMSAGMPAVVAQVQAALGGGFSVSTTGGSVLRVLDDGAAGTTDVLSASTKVTVTDLQSGVPELPLFVDGAGGEQPFTGAVTDGISQRRGFAARIAAADAVTDDPSLLVAATTTTASGDAARPTGLAEKLAGAVADFALGPGQSSFHGTLSDALRQVISRQSAEVATAGRDRDDTAARVENLATSVAETSGVSVDAELARLIQVQTAYAANARVLQAVREMFDVLNRI